MVAQGTNNDGDAWEDVLCGGTTPLRLLLIGDSVGAHFQIPPKFLTAADINDTTYDHALFDLSNEFDVPEKRYASLCCASALEITFLLVRITYGLPCR